MSLIQKMMYRYQYKDVYEILSEENFSFSFSDVLEKFPRIDGSQLYMFYMYAISRNETGKRHLAASETLLYLDPYMDGADDLIRWHLIRGMQINPLDISIVRFAVRTYYKRESSPFSDKELLGYARLVEAEWPEDEIAHEIIRECE